MKYFVGFLITLGLIFLLIILLFRGGGEPKTPTSNKTLVSYASTSAEVSLTTDGPINAVSEHRQIRITVSRDNVTYEELQGYDGNVTKMQPFANTENAYSNFLRALAIAGFTKGNTDKAMNDERGYCALGNRHIFEMNQAGRQIQRFWATSCGNPKTYLGNLSLTLELFQAQVPGYSDLSQDVDL